MKDVKVVGTKTYVAPIDDNLIEFMAIGTAMTKVKGIKVETHPLPVQAIISDKDTWIGDNFGRSLARLENS